ncbi:MAG: hypothetical protein Q9169_005642 [Polycauliona sp. 2 TL-2023]
MDESPKPEKNDWGFNMPRPELVKVNIDTTIQPTKSGLPRSPTISDDQPRKSLFHKDNQRPSFGPNFINFGADADKGYHGAPIFNKTTQRWNPTFYTRASGKICFPHGNMGATSSDELEAIIRSVGVMSGNRGHGSQSGIWIGPRHFLSTLHMHSWIDGTPSQGEIDVALQSTVSFDVETEIFSRLLGSDREGVRVRLVDALLDQDLGVFELLEECEDQDVWTDVGCLMECEEVMKGELKSGMRMAWVGFNGRIRNEDRWKIQDQVYRGLRGKVTFLDSAMKEFDLDELVKPESRCMMPGTLDAARVHAEHVVFGVSASLWQGSSGGPCVVLVGKNAGRIVGLGMKTPVFTCRRLTDWLTVCSQGHDACEEPYNIITGFPNGFVSRVRDFMTNRNSSRAARSTTSLQQSAGRSERSDVSIDARELFPRLSARKEDEKIA